jgi:hypothetical protein
MARIGGCVVVYRTDIVEVCHSRGGSTVLHEGCYRATIQGLEWIKWMLYGYIRITMDMSGCYIWIPYRDYSGFQWM